MYKAVKIQNKILKWHFYIVCISVMIKYDMQKCQQFASPSSTIKVHFIKADLSNVLYLNKSSQLWVLKD